MCSDKMNEAYREDCALVEKEALQCIQSVHIPVINIPSIRGISLANYRRLMNKCDVKVTEMDIVLVAVTDFVAAALACPPLFGWNLSDNSEQVAGVLADLGRRWTRLLRANQSRRVTLSALLESSLRCLDDQHVRHFQEARIAGQRPVVVDLIANDDLDVVLKANVATKTAASPKVDVFSKTNPGSKGFAACSPRVNPAPLPAKKLLTLHAFFPIRDADASTRTVAPDNERKEPTQPLIEPIGNSRPQVFAASQGQLIVYPSNPKVSPLGHVMPHPEPDACPSRTAVQSLLPLVNSTNVAKPKTSASMLKPVTDVLQAMMIAAKENKRKHADACRPGLNKLARKGC